MSEHPNIYKVWKDQLDYNTIVKVGEDRTQGEWMQNYILGAMSEMGELLRETPWKAHRQQNITHSVRTNMAEELADITKYVFSLWQLLDYNCDDMISCLNAKHEVLMQLLYQETETSHKNKMILMLDLDGVVADFRTGFLHWLAQQAKSPLMHMSSQEFGLHMDIDHGWDYASYDSLKREFEESGGYGRLPCYMNVVEAIRSLQRRNWFVIAYTGRPTTAYKRIWRDTWLWLSGWRIKPEELHFGNEERIAYAQKKAIHNKVVALEDNPILIQRYIASGIPVVVVPQPYNRTMPSLPLLSHLQEEMSGYEICTAIELHLRSTGEQHVR